MRSAHETLRSGDRAAWAQLVRTHQRGVYRFVYRYVRNEADAADLTQKTFVRAFGAAARLKENSELRSWLFKIAHNLALNHIRDSKARYALTDEMAVQEAVGARRLIDAEQLGALRRAIEKLPEKQRLIMELRIYDELSFKEVAQVASCSENNAKVNFHYAVKRLRRVLEGDSNA